jgi:enoyl-CoA hydratase/carnithine racemase
MASVVEVERVPIDGAGASADIVWLNRPEVLNAFNPEMLERFNAAIDDAEASPGVAAILLTGRGKGFCAGGDLRISHVMQRDKQRFPAYMEFTLGSFRRGFFSSKPVIALVNGAAVGGGLQFALWADIVIASELARMGDGHQNYGQMGGGGSLSLLPRVLGPARAKELVFSGRLLSGREAFEWGLVSRLVAPERLIATGLAIAADMAGAGGALTPVKATINDGYARETGLEMATQLEISTSARYTTTLPYGQLGGRAFEERRHEVRR